MWYNEFITLACHLRNVEAPVVQGAPGASNITFTLPGVLRANLRRELRRMQRPPIPGRRF